jgi:hypothetical protein
MSRRIRTRLPTYLSVGLGTFLFIGTHSPPSPVAIVGVDFSPVNERVSGSARVPGRLTAAGKLSPMTVATVAKIPATARGRSGQRGTGESRQKPVGLCPASPAWLSGAVGGTRHPVGHAPVTKGPKLRSHRRPRRRGQPPRGLRLRCPAVDHPPAAPAAATDCLRRSPPDLKAITDRPARAAERRSA